MNTILITGASRGIGAATAILAAQSGYAVAVNYLNNEKAAAEVIGQITESGGHARAYKANVSLPSEIEALFKALDDEMPPLDALVNNAGILEKQTRVEDLDPGRLQRIFQSNIYGPLFCSQQAIKRMSYKYGGHGGAIVNVSSIAARTGAPNEYVDYAASKGALDTFTIGLAAEVAAEGIRVNGVRPAFIRTDIHASGGDPARVDRLAPSIPLGRPGTPEEVARAIMWLVSGESAYTTGSFIEVSGGK